MTKIINNFNSLDYVQGTQTGVTLMDAMPRVAQYKYCQLGAIDETDDNMAKSDHVDAGELIRGGPKRRGSILYPNCHKEVRELVWK
jgi:hypothetical protein